MCVIRSKPFIHYDPAYEDGSNDPRGETMAKQESVRSCIPSVKEVQAMIKQNGKDAKFLRRLLRLAKDAERDDEPAEQDGNDAE